MSSKLHNPDQPNPQRSATAAFEEISPAKNGLYLNDLNAIARELGIRPSVRPGPKPGF